jgi:hypothetical protein
VTALLYATERQVTRAILALAFTGAGLLTLATRLARTDTK